MNLQQMLIMGRISSPIKTRTSGSTTKSYLSFSVAVNEYLGKQKGTKTTVYKILAFKPKMVIQKDIQEALEGDLIMVDGTVKAKNNKDGLAELVIIAGKFKVLK